MFLLALTTCIMVSVAALPDLRQIVGDCNQMCDENAPPMGDFSCPDGYVCKHSGCSATCVQEVSRRAVDCGVVICPTLCDEGRVMDHNGCPTCTCL